MAEQRYEAVRAVIADGDAVTDVAARFGVARKTVHAWLARYEAGGLEGLADRSHRPVVPAVGASRGSRPARPSPAKRQPGDGVRHGGNPCL